jgi:transposase
MDVAHRQERRRHSAELRAGVLQACAMPDASVASVALEHGLNANLAHRWAPITA